MPKIIRLVSAARDRAQDLARQASRGMLLRRASSGHVKGEKVDVTEFIEISEHDIDPVELSREFDRDLERSVSDHRMTREQLETPLTV